MYRFVDLNESYWTNPNGTEDAQCAILDTRTNRFLECDGKHVLGDLDEVRDAAGDRGVGLVPFGFFERKQGGTAPLTLADVIQAESAFANANVSPPYELRATVALLAPLLADGTALESAMKMDPLDWPLNEAVVGHASQTLLIAAEDGAKPRFSGKRTLPAF